MAGARNPRRRGSVHSFVAPKKRYAIEFLEARMMLSVGYGPNTGQLLASPSGIIPPPNAGGGQSSGFPASTHLVITPTFDSSITSDANATSIINAINSAIDFYYYAYSDPINVTIKFKEMSSGLG